MNETAHSKSSIAKKRSVNENIQKSPSSPVKKEYWNEIIQKSPNAPRKKMSEADVYQVKIRKKSPSNERYLKTKSSFQKALPTSSSYSSKVVVGKIPSAAKDPKEKSKKNE